MTSSAPNLVDFFIKSGLSPDLIGQAQRQADGALKGILEYARKRVGGNIIYRLEKFVHAEQLVEFLNKNKANISVWSMTYDTVNHNFVLVYETVMT